MADDGILFDSWEDFEDSGALDKQLDSIKVIKQKSNSMTEKLEVQDDSGRTAFSPQIKILKRQPGGGDAGRDSGQQAAKPVKTLEQREAEYAEARQRILGAAYSNNSNNSEDTDENEVTDTQTDRPSHLIQNLDELKLSDNCVMRQPRGPDGTTGFHVKR